jgi:hypothetical protein
VTKLPHWDHQLNADMTAAGIREVKTELIELKDHTAETKTELRDHVADATTELEIMQPSSKTIELLLRSVWSFQPESLNQKNKGITDQRFPPYLELSSW